MADGKVDHPVVEEVTLEATAIVDDKLRDHGDWKSYEDFFDSFVQAVGPDGVATVVELAVEETAFHEDRWHVCGRRKGRKDIVHEEEVGNVLCGVGGFDSVMVKALLFSKIKSLTTGIDTDCVS